MKAPLTEDEYKRKTQDELKELLDATNLLQSSKVHHRNITSYYLFEQNGHK